MNHKLIYLLDDDELSNMLNRQFLNFSLPQSTVIQFVDAIDLIKNLIKKRIETPDLLLLDISMPELSGWEFLDYCKRYQLDFDVMMLTSSLHFEDVDRAYSYPQVKNYIPKPLTQESIINCIKEGKRVNIGMD